ncbi:AraC family transcriptional regulator [Streptomyces sp. NRRL WC-3742]|uniref:AraC family transcriptional regulator n=1 Tax=Streptomyces sp. NRRL WC-3742 TaxID=1463934 RepID=UPI0004CBC7AF|nr:AraC family transcriptional regulator [Streptomyces sp. NRRL WC-3742]
MDTLTGLLDGPKARGAFLLRSVLTPPWALRIEDGAPLSVVTPVRGDTWILPEHGSPLLLRPGDVAIVRGPQPYTVADDPATPVDVVVGPGQVCSRDGEDVSASLSLGVRTWGDGSEADEHASVLLSGTYQAEHEIGQRLLGFLPTLLVRPAGTGADDTLVRLLAAELGRDEPAQELVLDRILDLLVVSVLRSWLAAPDSGAPAWYRAQHDPVVGPVLRLMHDDPAAAWTVADLAHRVGVSRAGLARRFTALVGEPPMAYLAGWRLALAADLLREPDCTIASAARRVGYSNAFALSAAFKRVRGLSPQEHRRLAASGQAPARPLEAGAASVPRTVILAG